MSSPTIKDVAKLAGVSISTVSRVMNNSKPVSTEAKMRVLDAIEKLDFKPNELARSLVMKRSNLIGVVVKDIGIPYMANIISQTFRRTLRSPSAPCFPSSPQRSPSTATFLRSPAILYAAHAPGPPFSQRGRPATNRATLSARSAAIRFALPCMSRKRRPIRYGGTSPRPTSLLTTIRWEGSFSRLEAEKFTKSASTDERISRSADAQTASSSLSDAPLDRKRRVRKSVRQSSNNVPRIEDTAPGRSATSPSHVLQEALRRLRCSAILCAISESCASAVARYVTSPSDRAILSANALLPLRAPPSNSVITAAPPSKAPYSKRDSTLTFFAMIRWSIRYRLVRAIDLRSASVTVQSKSYQPMTRAASFGSMRVSFAASNAEASPSERIKASVSRRILRKARINPGFFSTNSLRATTKERPRTRPRPSAITRAPAFSARTISLPTSRAASTLPAKSVADACGIGMGKNSTSDSFTPFSPSARTKTS